MRGAGGVAAVLVVLALAGCSGPFEPKDVPEASFTVSRRDLRIEVDASGSKDPQGGNLSFVWEWGDGTPNATSVRAAHTYASEGNYTLTLVARNELGHTDSRSQTVHAFPNQPPLAAFDLTPRGIGVSVDAAASRDPDPDGQVAAYAWDWGDGSSPGSGRSAAHNYSAEGPYEVRLTVTDDQGATATTTRNATLVFPDTDGDGHKDNVDAFPKDALEWRDRDGDGVGDRYDAFPDDPLETRDTDQDGVGDRRDAFPRDAAEWRDGDGDGVGDTGDIMPAFSLVSSWTSPALFAPLLAIALGVGGYVWWSRRAPVAVTTPSGTAERELQRKYELHRELGRGGFGTAWLATHRELGRQVVVKRLHPTWVAIADARERFRREARILAALDSAHVARIHDVEVDDASAWLAMEFVDGGSLEERLRAGPMPWKDAKRIVLDVLAGLEVVHGARLLHRDIKPSNILLTSAGAAKLCDFGIARSADQTSDLTATGASPGTPAYMAPEQAQGRADERSDLYAVAAVMRKAVGGAQVPSTLRKWIAMGMAQEPAKRFESAAAMAAALRGIEA